MLSVFDVKMTQKNKLLISNERLLKKIKEVYSNAINELGIDDAIIEKDFRKLQKQFDNFGKGWLESIDCRKNEFMEYLAKINKRVNHKD